MKQKYSIVNDITGAEFEIELDPRDVEQSRELWKQLGWSVFPWPKQ